MPHRNIDCEKGQENAKCQCCIVDPKKNCSECQLCKSCDKSLKIITQNK